MDKKESFKNFISKHPEIMSYIKSKEMTFQDFYEIYDIYGEKESVWDKYFSSNITTNTKDKIIELSSLLKKVNIDNIEHHVNNAQKAISILQELSKKSPDIITSVERPISKLYGD